MERDDLLALFDRAAVIHFAGALDDGTPLLRAVHAVVVDGWLAFHGGPKGEKNLLLDRSVVAAAEEIIATLPSHFFGAQRACPATTWFMSVQARGVLQEATDPDFKAEVLQALMVKLQPEGGHRPVTADDPMYSRTVEGLRVARLPLDDLTGRDKRGQQKRPGILRKVLEGLWQRGGPGDVAAIESIRAANPGLEPPELLQGPPRLRADPAKVQPPYGDSGPRGSPDTGG